MSEWITNCHGTEIRAGQVWADNDWRMSGRTVRVVAIEKSMVRRAVCEVLTDHTTGNPPARPRTVRIKVDRFHPTSTGYRRIR